MKPWHGTLAVLCGLVLGAVVLLCEASVTDQYVASVYLTTGVLLLLCAVPPILLRARILEPICAVGAFYFVNYGVGAIFLLYFRDYQFPGTSRYLFAASAVAAAGYASLVCGYYFARGGVGRVLPQLPQVWSRSRAKAAILLLYGAGWAARLLLIFKYHMFFNDVVGAANKVTYIGFINIVEGFCIISAVLAITLQAASRRSWLLTIALLLMLPTEFFLSLLRGIKAGPLMLLGIFFLVRYAFGRTKLMPGLVAAAAVGLLVFLFMNLYRGEGLGFGDPRKADLSTRAIRTAALRAATEMAATEPLLVAAYGLELVTARLSHVNELAAIVKRLGGAMEFQVGWSYAPFAASVVPRVLWPERPQNMFDNDFAQRLGFISRGDFITIINIPTAPTEMYVNFGMIGVVVSMFLYGAFMRIAYQWLIGSARPSPSSMVVYVLCLTTFLSSLDMPFAVVYMAFSRGLVVLLLVLWCIKAPQRRLVGEGA